MSRVVWIAATPRIAATGAAVTVRLAGGGDAAPYYRGGEHWRAGIVSLPRWRAELGFDENGWTGGTVPQTGNLIFKPGQPSLVDALAAHYWIDAPITVETGPEGGPFAVELTGTVAAAAIVDGALVLELGDLSKALDKPVAAARFAGSGGAEGGGEAAGRVKRRSWGRVFNVEGRVFDKANNLFEFGDPAYPIQQTDVVRDKGRAAAPAPAVLAWQGSIDATIAALAASAPAPGSGVVAPSIGGMVKWWTQPAGPLTADLKGEIGAGYVETAPEIAARLLAAVAGPGVANAGTMAAVRAGAAGLHIGDDDETTAQALDRLLLGVSLLWILEPAGTIRLREWSFANPVETVVARSVSRRRSFPPVETRRIGYQRSHRIHGDGEIAAVLQVGDVAGLAPIATDQGAKAKLDGVAAGATAGATAGTNIKHPISGAVLPSSNLLNEQVGYAVRDGAAAPLVYEFTSGSDGWAAINGALSASDGILTLSATSGDPWVQNTGLSFAGSSYPRIRARFRSLVASATWQGQVYFGTSFRGSAAWSEAYTKQIPAPPGWAGGEWVEAEWDMLALTAGGVDWRDSTITGVRLDLNQQHSNVEIDWIAIGAFAAKAGVVSGVADEATKGSDWNTDTRNRPTELIDGRIGTGLNVGGELQSRILDGATFGPAGETVLKQRGRNSRLQSTNGQASANFIASDGRSMVRIGAIGNVRDGDVVSFPAALPDVPKMVWGPGGIAAPQDKNISVYAENLTVSGFTMRARYQTVTPGTTYTDSTVTGGGAGEPTQVIDRSNGNTPYDGRFIFRVSTTVGNLAPGEPGIVAVNLYMRKGGAWTLVGSYEFQSSNSSNDISVFSTCDFGAGAEFGMSIAMAEGGGTTASLVHVRYTDGTVTNVTLNPAGSSDFSYQAVLQ